MSQSTVPGSWSYTVEGFQAHLRKHELCNCGRRGEGCSADMDEFATGSSNETSAYGPGAEPMAQEGQQGLGLTPGGSSGRVAAAVAADISSRPASPVPTRWLDP